MTDNKKKLLKLLPNKNCGACGVKDCGEFAEKLLKNKIKIKKCKFLQKDKFEKERKEIKKFLGKLI